MRPRFALSRGRYGKFGLHGGLLLSDAGREARSVPYRPLLPAWVDSAHVVRGGDMEQRDGPG